MLTDSKQADADVLCRDAHYLAYLFIREVFEPEQDDSAVEGLQALDALVEQVHLARVLVAVLKEVDVHRQANGSRAPFLPVERDAGVEGDAVNPCPDVAAMSEAIVAFPKVDEHLLEEVVHLVVVFREHVANGVDSALVFAYGLGELSFCVCHCRLFRIISPIRRNKVTKNYTNHKKMFVTLCHKRYNVMASRQASH